MGIRCAKFSRKSQDSGWVLYESVSMTCFPIIFKSENEAWDFTIYLRKVLQQEIYNVNLDGLGYYYEMYISRTNRRP